jgi:alkanesulfonate monooxygenase SsuD/methylene tetrahydromethanopterin reductase-like flavin-dependent oxidoreductase (luciferase family)
VQYISEFKLGILDFGYRDTTSPTDIMKDVIESAGIADRLDYSCYWFGEHHNGCKAWSNPEMMVPILAGVTERLNIGVAGILLAAHSPYRVALNFKLLSNIFPGRIDLGLANGVVKPHILRRMLCDDTKGIDMKCLFAGKLEELLDYLYRTREVYEREKIAIPPIGGVTPNVWKLGITFDNMAYCIADKLNFCFSLFHTQAPIDYDTDRKHIEAYRKQFYAVHGFAPTIRLAFAGICDKTMARAQATDRSLNPSTTPFKENSIIGDPCFFKEKLIELYEGYSISEFVFYDKSGDLEKRRWALESLAEVFDM